MRELEREVHGESTEGESVCKGRRGIRTETRGSQTRGSRYVDVSNAGF